MVAIYALSSPFEPGQVPYRSRSKFGGEENDPAMNRRVPELENKRALWYERCNKFDLGPLP